MLIAMPVSYPIKKLLKADRVVTLSNGVLQSKVTGADKHQTQERSKARIMFTQSSVQNVSVCKNVLCEGVI